MKAYDVMDGQKGRGQPRKTRLNQVNEVQKERYIRIEMNMQAYMNRCMDVAEAKVCKNREK